MVTFPDLIKSGRVPIGLIVRIPSIEIVEIVAEAGYHFIFIDAEQSPFSPREIDTLISVARGTGIRSLVRIDEHSLGDIQRYLNSGADGIVVPRVSTPARAERALRPMCYPPNGVRGYSRGSRGAHWGIGARAPDRVEDDVWRVLMIEDRSGVDHVEEILATPGLDAIFIGSGDLSLDLGVPKDSPELEAAMEQVRASARRAGVPVGTIGDGTEQVERLIALGYDFLLVGDDLGVFAKGVNALLDGLSQT